jgi:transcriptional regulator with XRE-family HTH domain
MAVDNPELGGFPELSPLGKQLEMLRIERGLSKQQLARMAETSRQQLWRVMTGKSELTMSLSHRLAEVLQVDPASFREAGMGSRNMRAYFGEPRPHPLAQIPSFEDYVADPAAILRTLQSLPGGSTGHELKRDFMNCVEEVAQRTGLKVTQSFFELRRRLVNGEL